MFQEVRVDNVACVRSAGISVLFDPVQFTLIGIDKKILYCRIIQILHTNDHDRKHSLADKELTGVWFVHEPY